MATLEHLESRQRTPLQARTLIGRSSACELTLRFREISGEHALIRWTGEGWELRDLGSRNGTSIDSRRLEPGERVRLSVGAELTFGPPAHTWRLLCDAPPTASAAPLSGGPAVLAERGLLVLPDSEHPEVTLYQGVDGRWVLEGEQGTVALEEQQVIAAGGRRWRLRFPAGIEETVDAGSVAPRLSGGQLRFRVSPDEEHVQVTLQSGSASLDLEERVHHYLLLTLARLYETDRGEGVDAGSCGWVHQQSLSGMLRIEDSQINLQIYRIRRQLAQAGVLGAPGIIERRGRTRMLRIGVDDFVFESL